MINYFNLKHQTTTEDHLWNIGTILIMWIILSNISQSQFNNINYIMDALVFNLNLHLANRWWFALIKQTNINQDLIKIISFNQNNNAGLAALLLFMNIIFTNGNLFTMMGICFLINNFVLLLRQTIILYHEQK